MRYCVKYFVKLANEYSLYLSQLFQFGTLVMYKDDNDWLQVYKLSRKSIRGCCWDLDSSVGHQLGSLLGKLVHCENRGRINEQRQVRVLMAELV